MTLKKLPDGTYAGEITTGQFARVTKESKSATGQIWLLEVTNAQGAPLRVPSHFKTLKAAKAALGV